MPFGPEDDEPPLGQETWDAVEELTDAQENDPDAYQAWSDTVDEYNEEHPNEEL